MTTAIKLFVSEFCGHCHEIARLAQEGKIATHPGTEVEVIDITSEEGFIEFARLAEKLGIDHVPSAYQGENLCSLKVDAGSLIIDCPITSDASH